MTPDEFVDAMSLPVWQAMAVVRWLEGRVRNRPKVGEVTPEKAALTDGDCASQELLLVALREHFPDVVLNVEEDTPTAARFAGNDSEYTVVIDPIDGTLRYLLGDGLYAIILGLERDGLVLAALIGVPQRGILVRAIRGQGVELALDQRRFTSPTLGGEGREVAVSPGLPRDVARALGQQGLEPRTAAGGVIGIAPLLPGMVGGVRIIGQPQGLSRRAWVAALPTLEAGGCVEGLSGAFPERYTPGEPGLLVAASPREIARLRSSLSVAA
jgi:myo-inositol-1(or 4)-monophosphatase